MKIRALVENQSNGEMKAKHGLSLYIETEKYKILFDVGPDETLFENSRRAGVDLPAVDTVILSHGHADHGGALEKFLRLNKTAKVYVQRKAFEKHYSRFLFLKINVGIPEKLSDHPRLVIVDGDYKIDGELELFTVNASEKCHSDANDALYAGNRRDDFLHEQNLIIHGQKNVLIMGCGHKGVINILERAGVYRPCVCVGGYHLFNPVTKKTVSKQLLDEIAKEMAQYNLTYYTCHCTEKKAYAYLAENVKDMHYLSCGETIVI